MRYSDQVILAKVHAASVTQGVCDYQGVHVEGLKGQRHLIHESGSSDAASDVRSEQVGAQHHDGAYAFRQLTE